MIDLMIGSDGREDLVSGEKRRRRLSIYSLREELKSWGGKLRGEWVEN